MDHSYEEIRDVTIDVLAGREKVNYCPDQYVHLLHGVAEVFDRREAQTSSGNLTGREPRLSNADEELFMDVFWDLFRQNILTLGYDRNNKGFPHCRISHFGKGLLKNSSVYFFHDVSTYEKQIQTSVPNIDDVTMIYLKEAMQAFRSGCLLSSSVMLGVAAEHTFLLLLDKIEGNPSHQPAFKNVFSERMILQKINKFKGIFDQNYLKGLPSEIKEDLDTHFAGIQAVIRNFRNQGGHPTGNIISREQAYVLLQIFIPYAKKIYQLIDYFA